MGRQRCLLPFSSLFRWSHWPISMMRMISDGRNQTQSTLFFTVISSSPKMSQRSCLQATYHKPVVLLVYVLLVASLCPCARSTCDVCGICGAARAVSFGGKCDVCQHSPRLCFLGNECFIWLALALLVKRIPFWCIQRCLWIFNTTITLNIFWRIAKPSGFRSSSNDALMCCYYRLAVLYQCGLTQQYITARCN